MGSLESRMLFLLRTCITDEESAQRASLNPLFLDVQTINYAIPFDITVRMYRKVIDFRTSFSRQGYKKDNEQQIDKNLIVSNSRCT